MWEAFLPLPTLPSIIIYNVDKEEQSTYGKTAQDSPLEFNLAAPEIPDNID